MNRSRIVEQMCREPDEESSFYSDTACGDMGVMIYNMPGGSRLRFITLWDARPCGSVSRSIRTEYPAGPLAWRSRRSA